MGPLMGSHLSLCSPRVEEMLGVEMSLPLGKSDDLPTKGSTSGVLGKGGLSKLQQI